MKYKRIKIAAALLVVGLIGGVIYNQVTAKKSYDYSDYYVETKTTKKESNKENEEASEKELSLSLLKKQIKMLLVFQNLMIELFMSRLYKLQIMIIMFVKISTKNIPMPGYRLYQQMEIQIQKML